MAQNYLARLIVGSALASLALSGCASSSAPQLPSASFVAMREGPGDQPAKLSLP